MLVQTTKARSNIVPSPGVEKENKTMGPKQDQTMKSISRLSATSRPSFQAEYDI
jgi:hypothetical protein